MATIKISALTEKTTMAGTEEVLINDSGISKKFSTQRFLDVKTGAETAETNAASSASSASTNASTATTKASEASTSATSASGSASTATTKASEASTSATNAATSASTASGHKDTATTKASEAATSATNAASSATSSASSATAAQTAQAATELAFDNFDDKFLGTKSSDPSADNDGNTLAEGVMYYNSGSNVIKFYNGSSWEAPSTAASNSATASATSATNAATSASGASSSASTATTKASEASTSATNAASSATAAATSATNAASSATAAASSATSAAGSATTATTQATNASNSASTATTQANTATTQASTATTKASEAATSATNSASSASTASTQATNSSNSASSSATAQAASEAARDAALAALDSFDDRYLGVKSSAPSVDNDGNALVQGTLYFDSGTDAMKVYDGSNWLNAYASLSGDVVSSADGATTIQAGAVDIAMLSATGTASGTTFLRGDNAWATPSGGGGSSTLGGLTDVDTSAITLIDGAVLRYNGTASEWQNTNLGLSLTPTASFSPSSIFQNSTITVTVTNWSSYTSPASACEIVNSSGVVVVASSTVVNNNDGTMSIVAPSATGSYTINVYVQDFGDLRSAPAQLALTVSTPITQTYRYWRIGSLTGGYEPKMGTVEMYTGANNTGTKYPPDGMTADTQTVGGYTYVLGGYSYSATYTLHDQTDYFSSGDARYSTGPWMLNGTATHESDGWTYDLGTARSLTSIRIQWAGTYYASGVTLYGSSNGSTWTSLQTTTGMGANTNWYSLLN
jgi:hypothetical protein